MQWTSVRRVGSVGLVLGVALALGACAGGDSQSGLPTSPRGSELADSILAQAASANPACATPVNIAIQIVKLYPAGKVRDQALVNYALVLAALGLRQPARAQTLMYQLWSLTLTQYNAGDLTGGTSSATSAATLALGTSLYCLVGLNPAGLTLGSGGSNSLVQVVFPSTTTQTDTTPNGQAGVQIPPTALTTPVTLVITPITTPTFTFPAGPLNTPLDQYGPFYEIHVIPQQTLSDFITIGQCLPVAENAPNSVLLAHNVGTGISILESVTPTFLNCAPAEVERNAPSPFELARRGELGAALARVGSLAVRLVTPTPAYAAGFTGVGGKAKSFSPFGAVDTTVVITATSSTSQAGATGSPAPSAPAVLVATPNGHTPVPGVTVTFAITAGSGDFTATASVAQVRTVNTTTNGSGAAAVGSWILGPGANTATATGGPYTISTAPASVAVLGNPITFSATGNAVIPYAPAAGPTPAYQSYLIGVPQPATVGTDTAGFSKLAPFAATNWVSAAAPFGNAYAIAFSLEPGCTLEIAPNVDPLWTNDPTGANQTYFLLRKSFTLPDSLTSGTIHVGVAVDNDVQVFLDGTNITSGADVTGFADHGGCPTQDSFIFSEPVTALTASASGTHLLAIMARDDGGTSYIDAQVTVTQP